MSGILAGILLARTAAGLVGGALGWRAVYGLAAGGMLVLGAALSRLLPAAPPDRSPPYRELLASMWTLLRTEPDLRQASLVGALVFGSFSVFWTTLAFFLETPPYHWGAGTAGLFGLLGLAGALGAPLVGRVADRRGPRFASGIALSVALASFGLLGLLGRWLPGLVAGVLVLDVGIQSAHVSNLARIHALEPTARSRRNTVYMVSYFAGGAAGTWLGVRAWTAYGWTGVSLAGAAFIAAALGTWAAPTGARPRSPGGAPPR
jgi:predicted MFS family arabinose efflux permease